MPFDENFKKAITNLVPTRTIPTSRTIDNGAVENALQGTIEADNARARASQSQIQKYQSMDNAAMGLAKTAENLKQDYDSNLNSELTTQLSNAHQSAMNFMRASHNPHDISVRSAQLTATIAGIHKAASGLPNREKNILQSYGQNYSESAVAYGNGKNNILNAQSFLNTAMNSMSASGNSLTTALKNSDSPKEKQSLIDSVGDKIQHLQDNEKYLTTEKGRQQSRSLIGMYSVQLKAATKQPNELEQDSSALNEHMIGNSAYEMETGKNYKAEGTRTFYGGDPSDLKSFVKDPMQLYDYNERVQTGRNAIANSRFVGDTALAASKSDDPATAQAGDLTLKLLKGNVAQFADINSPSTRELHQKSVIAGQGDDPQAYHTANQAYLKSLKAFMQHGNLSADTYDPFTAHQRTYIKGITGADWRMASDGDKQHAADALQSLSSETHNMIGTGAGSDSYAVIYASHQLSHTGSDNQQHASFPDQVLEGAQAFNPEVQKKLSSDKLWFTTNAETIDDNKIKSYGDVQNNVAGAYTDYSIGKLSTLYGIPVGALVQQNATQLTMKMRNGESYSDASADIKNNNLQVLAGFPIYSGTKSSWYGGNDKAFSVNPATMEANGMHGVSKGDYQRVMNNLVQNQYDKLLHKPTTETGIAGGSKNFSIDQVIKANKEVLGNVKDCHILTSNGQVIFSTGAGKHSILSATNISTAVDQDRSLKESLKKADTSYYGDYKGNMTL